MTLKSEILGAVPTASAISESIPAGSNSPNNSSRGFLSLRYLCFKVDYGPDS